VKLPDEVATAREVLRQNLRAWDEWLERAGEGLERDLPAMMPSPLEVQAEEEKAEREELETRPPPSPHEARRRQEVAEGFEKNWPKSPPGLRRKWRFPRR